MHARMLPSGKLCWSYNQAYAMACLSRPQVGEPRVAALPLAGNHQLHTLHRYKTYSQAS